MKVLDIFKNKMKPVKGEVSMSKESFRKEHRNLVKTLKTGSKKKRHEEAKKQAKELKERV